MSSPIFDRNFDPNYGKVVEITPTIRRIVAPNPSAFTFYGTGTYIVGCGKVAVIDPGPNDTTHFEALTSALRGETVTHILVTHTHLDHSPLTQALKDWCGAPSYGFGPHGGDRGGETVEAGADYDFKPDHRLMDGDQVAGDGWTFEAVHTPGHTSNHLCFSYFEEKALFSGDHVMGWSTSVISPPDGNMTDYMMSLEKLLKREEDVYYPTHGNPISNPKDHVRSFLFHRKDREEQILACLGRGLETIPQIVPAIYQDIPQKLHPAAARSVLAHMEKLLLEGLISADSDTVTLQSRYLRL